MEKVKILIVEDQLLIAQDIANILEDHGIEVLDIVTAGEDALKFLESTRADLILMDIELSGALDGISTAAMIDEKYAIPVIYLSDYTDDWLVKRAKKTRPANYLTKPFHKKDLIRAIEIASYNILQSGDQKHYGLNEHMFLKENHQFVKITYDEILYLKAHRSYCEVITAQKAFTFSNNMSNIHSQIDHPEFMRVHRSYVVNLRKITAINGNILKLGDHHTISMSREYREQVLDKLKLVK